jgi:hypothetical protein
MNTRRWRAHKPCDRHVKRESPQFVGISLEWEPPSDPDYRPGHLESRHLVVVVVLRNEGMRLAMAVAAIHESFQGHSLALVAQGETERRPGRSLTVGVTTALQSNASWEFRGSNRPTNRPRIGASAFGLVRGLV